MVKIVENITELVGNSPIIKLKKMVQKMEQKFI